MSNLKSLQRLDAALERAAAPAIATPDAAMSFHAWLHTYARVHVGNAYIPYSTEGREPLSAAILVIDYVLGNDCSYAPDETRATILGALSCGDVIPDAQLDICGGAQFGKTILALLLKTYLGTVKHRGCMYNLPDDDLVQGIIDTKERPDVIDQIPYVGKMLRIGKTLTPGGKAANRKGAMLYTDGQNNAVSMMRGLGKFPTSFTADVVVVDERDDVREEYADYLPGRMTTSDLRLMINIGTQRYSGAGQNALFEDGSQHVGVLDCPHCGRRHCPEEDWPDICRMSISGNRSPRDPRLDNAGRFCVDGQPVAKFHPEYEYYFGCVACGAPLPRERIYYQARQPDRIHAHRWSIRVAQLSCSGLPVSMFVSDWCTQAVRKPGKRAAFNCDRLAIPKSSAQKLAPAAIERAERVAPFAMSLAAESPPGAHRFAGLDTGDQCWFVCRDRAGEIRRLLWAESIADSDAAARCAALFATLKLDCLFVDAGPLRDLSRRLALDLNNLRSVDIRQFGDWQTKRVRFPGGVEWDGERGAWRGLRCAPVEFSGKPGSGITQAARPTPDNRHIYPVISCNRDEAIQTVIDELLTAEDGLAQVDEKTGALRTQPLFLLPRRDSDGSGALETYRKHLLAGSCKVRDADGREEHFVDGVANHYLLATVYAALAEEFAGIARARPPARPPIPFRSRVAAVLQSRRRREVYA